MSDWIHIGGKSSTLTPGEQRILRKLQDGQTEQQIRQDLNIAYGDLVDAIASIRSKGYNTEKENKMTEEKIERAKQLRKEGWTLARIGQELGVSGVTVKNMLDKTCQAESDVATPAPKPASEDVPESVLRCIQSTISDKLRDIERYQTRIAEETKEVAELQRYVRAYERG